MEDYLAEFHRVTKLKGKYLTTFGFNELSRYSSISIIKKLKKTWKELLVKYNLIDSLYEYAIEEYKNFAYKNHKANSTKFVRTHKYLKQYIFSDVIDIKKVRKEAGFINENYSGSYNAEMLEENFLYVSNIVGGIPSITQFEQHSKILASIYCDYYGIVGQLWDEVLKVMVGDKSKLEKYFKLRKEEYRGKSIEALLKGRKDSIPDFVLEKEFRRIFDYYLKTFGTHPTRRMFNEESIFNDMTYRRRYKLNWSQIIRKYGYQISEKNISEKICLEMVKDIFKVSYQRNHTFEWLIGIKGKHLYCDGYFKDLNLVIEFDGKHHRVAVENFGGKERFEKDKLNDALKKKLVEENGIKFIRISSKEKWQDKGYLEKIIKETLNK